ncbi:hypothetical protein JOL62DRAFT_583886 [Phyllosticta paracitricarpa]
MSVGIRLRTSSMLSPSHLLMQVTHPPIHPLRSDAMSLPTRAGRQAGRLLARIPATLRQWYRRRCGAGQLAVYSMLLMREVNLRECPGYLCMHLPSSVEAGRLSTSSVVPQLTHHLRITSRGRHHHCHHHLRASKQASKQATNAKRALYHDADSSILRRTCPSFAHLSFSSCVCRRKK